MGDRGNVFIVNERDTDGTAVGVYLYSHCGGSGLPEVVADTLKSPEGRARDDDTPYLTRILFDAITGLKGGEIGFGISTSLCDNEHDIIVIEPDASRIAVAPFSRHASTERLPDQDWQSFDDFIEANELKKVSA